MTNSIKDVTEDEREVGGCFVAREGTKNRVPPFLFDFFKYYIKKTLCGLIFHNPFCFVYNFTLFQISPVKMTEV